MTPKETILLTLRAEGFRHDPEFGFTLASGKRSDFYIDCKPALLRAHTISALGEALFAEISAACRIKGKIAQPTHVAGVAVGGVPLATAVSIHSLDKWARFDSLIVRKEPKGHGTGKLVEGSIGEWTNVVIVEDVVTTGGSSLKTVETLKATGCAVLGVFAIVDRLEGGREAIEDAGLYFSSLFTRDDFIQAKHAV